MKKLLFFASVLIGTAFLIYKVQAAEGDCKSCSCKELDAVYVANQVGGGRPPTYQWNVKRSYYELSDEGDIGGPANQAARNLYSEDDIADCPTDKPNSTQVSPVVKLKTYDQSEVFSPSCNVDLKLGYTYPASADSTHPETGGGEINKAICVPPPQ